MLCSQINNNNKKLRIEWRPTAEEFFSLPSIKINVDPATERIGIIVVVIRVCVFNQISKASKCVCSICNLVIWRAKHYLNQISSDQSCNMRLQIE